MKKITKSNKNIFLKKILPLLLLLSFIFNPLIVSAEVAETEINGELMNASSEFLRDLDFETWQLVAYKSPLFEDKLILRVIGYPGNLRIDHPTDLKVESGRKQWLLDDKTLLNVELANDARQAAAEFDLDELIKNLVIGICVFQVVLDEAQINYFVVNKKFRKKGFGSYFMSYLIKKCEKLNLKKLLLEVSQSNVTAERFYSRFDFSTVGIRKNYYKDGSHALLKEKKLTTK